MQVTEEINNGLQKILYNLFGQCQYRERKTDIQFLRLSTIPNPRA